MQAELIKQGVLAENIIMQSRDDEPKIEGVSVYVFPTGKVVIHKKNFNFGVTEVTTYHRYLENHQNADIYIE